MISRELLLMLLATLTSLLAISGSAGRTVENRSDALPGLTDRVESLPLTEISARPVEAAAGVDVAIQAGHWKANELPEALAHLRGSTGASGGGRTEAQVTLDIAQRVARLLRGQGLTVEVLPATVPTGFQADLFLSLHADGNSSSQARGYKVSTRWRSEVAALDALLVQSLEESYGSLVRMPLDGNNITRAMRGYYAYSTYRGEEYRLGGTTPAAILEMGFMTNAADRAIMFNNPDLVASGIVAGVNNYYSRLAEGRRLQASAERQAAISDFDRSAVVLTDNVNIRAGAGTSYRRLDTADFGESFSLMQASNGRSSNGGWYKVTLPGITGDAFISRDFVVIQQ
jgi:N-acetylmuramoyl-L-alanine amidase